MITVQEAEQIINRHTIQLQSEEVPLQQAAGRILEEQVLADRDFPPFNRVTMDGIAVKFSDLENGIKVFNIAGIQAAGVAPMSIDQPGQALEVMTGAVMPEGTDTVIPYELISISENDKKATVVEALTTKGKNVHYKGSDRPQGSVILKSGTVIGAAEIGVAATVGKSTLSVRKAPKVAIVSTGDELVPIDQNPLPHQIRSSNAATLVTCLKDWAIEPGVYHLGDDLQGTTSTLKSLIDTYQILILSGGVSKGKFDYVPQALGSIQVKKDFHRIKQRPGKPLWFGTHESGTIVFAFPGNPVSSFMCFHRYLKPWLQRCMGLSVPVMQAVLTDTIYFKPALTYFAQVKISLEKGILYAQPVEGHGSGDLANLADADGFIELPATKTRFLKGENYPIYPFRSKI